MIEFIKMFIHSNMLEIHLPLCGISVANHNVHLAKQFFFILMLLICQYWH